LNSTNIFNQIARVGQFACQSFIPKEFVVSELESHFFINLCCSIIAHPENQRGGGEQEKQQKDVESHFET
jgi:hypothetical protein